MKPVLPSLGIALLSACASAPPPVVVTEAPRSATPYDSKAEHAIAVAQVASRGDRSYASVWTAPHIQADFVRKFIEGC